MNKERVFWMAGGSILTIAFFLIAQQFFFGESSAEELSSGEVTERVEERFQAQVQSIKKNDDQFEVKIKESNGQYLVLVDSIEGKVLEIQALSTPTGESEDDGENKNANEQNEANQQMMTINEAKTKVMQSYNGEISSIKRNDEGSPYFDVIIENKQETIQVHVDAETGQLKEQKRVSKEQSNQEQPKQEEQEQEQSSQEQPKKEQPKQEKPKKEQPKKEESKKEEKPKQQTLISRQEAGQIALQKVAGELEDIELKKVDGTSYYHVEVEKEVGDDDQEYIIRINAISGKVISVSQDSDDDDDDDDDDD